MIRLVKRFRLGKGAFVYWVTAPRLRPSLSQRSDGVRPIFWLALLAVMAGCIVIAHWPK